MRLPLAKVWVCHFSPFFPSAYLPRFCPIVTWICGTLPARLGPSPSGRFYPLETWLRLDFLQTGGRIQCAINGQAVLDVEDRADQNNGPVLTAGRFAIRCMTRTDILIRNLSVRTRPLWHD